MKLLKELCKDYKIMASIFKQLLLRDSNRDYSVDKQIILQNKKISNSRTENPKINRKNKAKASLIKL